LTEGAKIEGAFCIVFCVCDFTGATDSEGALIDVTATLFDLGGGTATSAAVIGAVIDLDEATVVGAGRGATTDSDTGSGNGFEKRLGFVLPENLDLDPCNPITGSGTDTSAATDS
jgi:hypothetical protein